MPGPPRRGAAVLCHVTHTLAKLRFRSFSPQFSSDVASLDRWLRCLVSISSLQAWGRLVAQPANSYSFPCQGGAVASSLSFPGVSPSRLPTNAPSLSSRFAEISEPGRLWDTRLSPD